MVQQVRMKESYMAPGSTSTATRRVFGFGNHPDAFEQDAHPVTAASVSGQSFRIIMDELLVGNNIEEIACRGPVDMDAYDRVPLGATPDDIAKCASAQDVLPRTCQGEFAVCMCKNASGCLVGTTMVNEGAPVGVLDINQDGAGDDTRMIQGAVGLRCGTVDVPIDLDMSYWNPSGNQLVPAMGGFDALGPALVLVPQRGLPTNLNCNLVFSPDVVDKQGEQVCAPANGDITGNCAGGDTTAVAFKTEPLTLLSTVDDMQTGVSRTDALIFVANTPVDMTTAAGAVTVTEGAANTPYTQFTVAVAMNRNVTITWTAATGLAANTLYRVTVGTGLKDAFGQPLPAPTVITFTTGAL